MPEYAQIQTYITCNKHSFPVIVQQYREVLDKLGCIHIEVREWLMHIMWFSDQPDFAVTSDSAPSVSFISGEERLQAKLWLAVYIAEEDAEKRWVEVGFLFEAETLRERASLRYKPTTGALIWSILKAFAREFRQTGVYFTDEWQDGQSWRTLVSGKGDFWSFDAALLPKEIVYRYEPFPQAFAITPFEQDLGFALQERWLMLPWLT